MKFDLNKVWDKAKQKAFKNAFNFTQLIEHKGGTGSLRRKITHKEYLKRKKRLKAQKESRRKKRKVS